jgi:hypothetical protein
VPELVRRAAPAIRYLLAQLQQARQEIAEAREACPSVRMQDNFDAPLLKLINNEVVRGFKLDSWLADAQRQLQQARQERDTWEQRHEQLRQTYSDACLALQQAREALANHAVQCPQCQQAALKAGR